MDEIYKRLSEVPLKRRGIVALMIAVITTGLWYFLSIRPIEAKIIAQQDQERRIRAKLRNKSETDEKIKNLQANIAGQKNERTRLGEKFPSQADISVLLSKIHERARDSDLRIESFEQGPIIERELYARIEVTMGFKGTFIQIINFINELSDVRGLDRIVNVENLSLKRSSSDSMKPILTGSFLLVTFMSKSSLDTSKAKPQP